MKRVLKMIVPVLFVIFIKSIPERMPLHGVDLFGWWMVCINTQHANAVAFEASVQRNNSFIVGFNQ